MTGILTLLVIAAVSWALYLLNRLLVRPRGLPLPPGPARLPLIGNLLDLPKEYKWIYWSKYKELYGPISSLSVMGQNFIILNDQSSCVELLEKRSTNYSDRPLFLFAYLYVLPISACIEFLINFIWSILLLQGRLGQQHTFVAVW